MPLRCVDPVIQKSIHAFDLSAEDWLKLKAENKRDRRLRMPCCDAQVTFRRSKLGTRFFAHKSVGSCATAPETEAHLRLKQIAVEVARANGWKAGAEIGGRCPSGDCWTADVLATRGNAKIAIEIQWSGQTSDETARRQARYADSGVRGLWLMRKLAAPISEAVPAARVSQAEGQFFAYLPAGFTEQVLTVEEFLDAAFKRRLRFGLPVGALAQLTLQAGAASCWKCGKETRIITDFSVAVGPHEFSFHVADTEAALALFKPIYAALPADLEIGAIKRRYSSMIGGAYISNGCFHCDALFGQFHESEACEQRTTALATKIRVDEQWQKFLINVEDCSGWGVFQF